jgi:hypothetical protein
MLFSCWMNVRWRALRFQLRVMARLHSHACWLPSTLPSDASCAPDLFFRCLTIFGSRGMPRYWNFQLRMCALALRASAGSQTRSGAIAVRSRFVLRYMSSVCHSICLTIFAAAG